MTYRMQMDLGFANGWNFMLEIRFIEEDGKTYIYYENLDLTISAKSMEQVLAELQFIIPVAVEKYKTAQLEKL